MKNTVALIMILFIGFGIMAQSPATYRQKVGDDQPVPSAVESKFKSQYEGALAATWYVTDLAYWYLDFGSNWYGLWYGPKMLDIYTYDTPPYYEVEFVKKTAESARAVYNQYGAWYETRTQIRELPEAISEALKNGKYGEWKISEHKEIVEQPGTDSQTYRLLVSKGGKKLILSLNEKGQITNTKQLQQKVEKKEK